MILIYPHLRFYLWASIRNSISGKRNSFNNSLLPHIQYRSIDVSIYTAPYTTMILQPLRALYHNVISYMRERKSVIDANHWLRFPFILSRTQYIACHCLFGPWRKVCICENLFNVSIIVISLHLLMPPPTLSHRSRTGLISLSLLLNCSSLVCVCAHAHSVTMISETFSVQWFQWLTNQ